VQVIWQYANRDRLEWSALSDYSVCLSKAIDLDHQKIALPFRENDSEKENAAPDFGSNVPRHDA
jgi:hypothetical protein